MNNPAIRSDHACIHCGTLMTGRRGETTEFCCHGCETAYAILHDKGLEEYYGLRQSLEGEACPVQPSGRSFAEFDDPAVLNSYAPPLGDGTRRITLLLGNLQCAACVWLVEHVLAREPGVLSARLNFVRRSLVVNWDPDKISLSQIGHVLDRVGYEAHLDHLQERETQRRQEDRDMWMRVGVAFALLMNLMILALPLYTGEYWGISGPHAEFFRWLSGLLTAPVALYCAAPFHRAAWTAVRTRTIHIDIPISIGVWIAFGATVASLITGSDMLYGDSLAGLVFLMLMSRLILQLGTRRAERAADALLKLGAPTARVLNGNVFVDVATESVRTGDLLEVRPGEIIVVDGVVESGVSRLDNTVLTGESRPVPVEPGHTVAAGSGNLSAVLRIRATSVGHDTRLARITRQLSDHAQQRTPIVKHLDQVAKLFTIGTLSLTFLTGIVWWLWIDAAHAIPVAIAVAVVACPCALALGAPLVFSTARGQAARLGIVIRSPEAFERLQKIKFIAFDKTGTLTVGQPAVVAWTGATEVHDLDLATLVAALESQSLHPLAQALVRYRGEVASLPATESSEEFPGRGIVGTVAGIPLRVGKPGWASPVSPSELVSLAEERPLTPVAIAVRGVHVATAWIADALRPETAAVIETLHNAGYETALVSGDRRTIAVDVAQQVRIRHVFADVSPEQKVETMLQLASHTPVAMVGDGINDAAAMRAAAVGIAVRGSAPLSLESADVYLTRPGLQAVLDVIALSRGVVRSLRRNFVIGIAFNVVGIVAAASGYIGPLQAAVWMPISSITILVSSLWPSKLLQVQSPRP